MVCERWCLFITRSIRNRSYYCADIYQMYIIITIYKVKVKNDVYRAIEPEGTEVYVIYHLFL